MPAYDLLPMEYYKADGVNFGTVVTSRGCPFNCIFCSSSLQFGKKWRTVTTVADVEQELMPIPIIIALQIQVAYITKKPMKGL